MVKYILENTSIYTFAILFLIPRMKIFGSESFEKKM
jgi:hypothetical protein